MGRAFLLGAMLALLIFVEAAAQAPPNNGDDSGDAGGDAIRVKITDATGEAVAATAIVWRYSMAGSASVATVEIPAEGCEIADAEHAAIWGTTADGAHFAAANVGMIADADGTATVRAANAGLGYIQPVLADPSRCDASVRASVEPLIGHISANSTTIFQRAQLRISPPWASAGPRAGDENWPAEIACDVPMIGEIAAPVVVARRIGDEFGPGFRANVGTADGTQIGSETGLVGGPQNFWIGPAGRLEIALECDRPLAKTMVVFRRAAPENLVPFSDELRRFLRAHGDPRLPAITPLTGTFVADEKGVVDFGELPAGDYMIFECVPLRAGEFVVADPGNHLMFSMREKLVRVSAGKRTRESYRVTDWKPFRIAIRDKAGNDLAHDGLVVRFSCEWFDFGVPYAPDDSGMMALSRVPTPPDPEEMPLEVWAASPRFGRVKLATMQVSDKAPDAAHRLVFTGPNARIPVQPNEYAIDLTARLAVELAAVGQISVPAISVSDLDARARFRVAHSFVEFRVSEADLASVLALLSRAAHVPFDAPAALLADLGDIEFDMELPRISVEQAMRLVGSFVGVEFVLAGGKFYVCESADDPALLARVAADGFAVVPTATLHLGAGDTQRIEFGPMPQTIAVREGGAVVTLDGLPNHACRVLEVGENATVALDWPTLAGIRARFPDANNHTVELHRIGDRDAGPVDVFALATATAEAEFASPPLWPGRYRITVDGGASAEFEVPGAAEIKVGSAVVHVKPLQWCCR